MFKMYLGALYQALVRAYSLIPSRTLRYICYAKISKMKVDRSATIHMFTEVRSPKNITIGRKAIIGNYCIIDGREGLEIGENVNISSGVYIWTQHHDINSPCFSTVGEGVTISDYAWVCSKAIILPGVTVGKGAVIASGAVVTKDVEGWSIVAGIPAKKIGERSAVSYELPRGMAFY